MQAVLAAKAAEARGEDEDEGEDGVDILTRTLASTSLSRYFISTCERGGEKALTIRVLHSNWLASWPLLG